MRSWVVVLGMFVVVAGAREVAASTVAERSGKLLDACPPSWSGGLATLPYGTGDANAVLQHAFTLASVQTGMHEMERRGYVRRSDLDVAWTRPGYSCVVLAYEIPGSDPLTPGSAQPVLVAISKPMSVQGRGCVPAGEVFGSLVRDSSGSLTPTIMEGDSMFFVVSDARSLLTTGTAPDGGPSISDEDLAFRIQHYETSRAEGYATSPGMAFLQQQWLSSSFSGATSAAVGATLTSLLPPNVPTFQTTAIRASIGFYTGWVTTSTMFWANPPDTTHIGRP